MKEKKKGLIYEYKRVRKSKEQEKIDKFVPQIVKFANKIKAKKMSKNLYVIFHCISNSLGLTTIQELDLIEYYRFMLMRQNLYNTIMIDVMSGRHNITLPDEMLKKIIK